LTRIESRPSRRRAWEYLFFVDLDGHVADEKVGRALAELKKRTERVKVLGSYPRADEAVVVTEKP
jgi:chorismate mutase/prephenate dehydratase